MKSLTRFVCTTALATTAALFLTPFVSYAGGLAGAPQVVAGAVTFGQDGNLRTINQTSGTAIINWQDFSIGAGDITRFIQPGANSAILNRVLGANPSLLNGRLQANGSIYLINPNGVMVGPQGRIDVGAFFASTLNVSDDEFLKGGALRFAGDSRAGVENLGKITATEGDVMLIAYTARNAGTINAAKGVAGLAAGSEVLLTHSGDQRIAVKSGLSAGGLATGVENTGLVQAAQAELKAAGGSIYALAVNQSGIVRATGVENINGRVLLVADGGDVHVSGEITAHQADGSGGQILLGGGYQGKDAAVANAANTVVTASAKLDASASTANGSGGEIVVWADHSTQFAGSVAARGGSAGGDGGSLEVSGQHSLDFTGVADTSAANGRRGQLLLDPDAIIISTAADQDLFGQGGFVQGQAVPSYLNNGTLNSLLAMTDVFVQAGDNTSPAGFNGISVNADIGWSSGTNLTLISRDTIAINANINGGTTGSLTLRPGTVSAGDATTGAITLAANKAITVNTLTIEKSFFASPGGTDIGAINLAGTVNATTIDLIRDGSGVTGDILINNAANQIGTLRGTYADGAINGALRVTDSAGGLILDGNLSGVTGAVEIVTNGNLTVNSGALVQNTGASDLVLAARGGSFVNQADAAAIDAGGAGRYLIYSDSPANTTKGGLTGATTYNKTYAGNAPATITASGDRFLYSLAPTLTFTADNLSKTYGAANPSFTYAVTGLLAGDTLAAAISGAPDLSSIATAATGAGPATISLTNGSLALSDLGYGLSLQSGTLTIDRAPLTITANAASKIYGAALPTFSANYTGFVNSDTSSAVSGLSFSTTALAGSNVGSYPITAFGATAANYTLTYAPGNLVVNQAPLTITATSTSKTYGAANPAFTATYSGLVNSDTASAVSGLSFGTTAQTGSSVGSYPITPSGATAGNYALTYLPGALTINQAPLTITANNASRVFGVANPSFTALFSGLVNGDNSSVVTGLSLTTAADVNSAVGNYAITAAGATAGNYNISFIPGSLAIANAILTITADDFSRLYGAANPAFTAGYAGFTGGDTSAIVSGLQFSTSATPNSGVGSYAITPFGATAPNYGINFVSGSLSISPAALTIRASDAARTYGAANGTLGGTFTGLVAGDTAASISGVQFATTADPGTGVGSYAITTSGATNANYTITQQPGTLTIDPAPLTIKADNLGRIFGVANPSLTATYTGLVNGETSSVVSGGLPSTTAVIQSSVGSYPVTLSGATAANYAITLVPGTFSIAAAPLTITADSFSRIYGAANPLFTASYSGFTNGNTPAVVTGLQFNSSATVNSGVGTYTITPFGAAAPNYAISFMPGSLSISPAALTIRPDDLSRTYGAANPTFTASYSGLVNGDASSVVSGLQLNTAALPSSNVGAYDITASGATAANYALTYEAGSLTVNKAPLKITADSTNKTYGEANPAFTALYSGFVNNDTSSVVSGLSFSTSATDASSVGGYPITVTGASAANYAITTNTGLLSVQRAPVTVTAGNASRFYGDANPAFSGTLSGFVNGDTASVLTSAPNFGSSADLTSNVGGYAITGTGAAAANYTFNYLPGTLTINPAVLAVRADNLTRSYGDANPTLTYSVSGLKNGDSADGKFFVFVLGTTAAADTPVGNYNILFSGNDTPNDNYTTFFANGTLSVLARPLTIRPDHLSREYGLANPAFTATFTGLASFDTASVIPNLGFTTTAAVGSNVGDYTVTPSSGTNSNYAITWLPNLLSVTPAPLSVLAGGDLTRTYGDANPAFTPFLTSGSLRNGDTFAGLGLSITTAATPASSVGKYSLTPLLSNPNYTVTTIDGSLTILPAIIDVTVGNSTRLYGDANPANIPVSATGLKLSDTAASVVTISSSATPQAPVGTYSLSANGSSPNYQVRSVTPGSLQITPAPLNVTVGNGTRAYGDPNPTDVPLTVTGLKLGDTASTVVGVTSAATPQQAVGSAFLTPTLLNFNYSLTNVTPGILQITPAQLDVSLANAFRSYGDPTPAITLQAVTGLKFSEDPTTIVRGGTTTTLQQDVGTTPLTASSLSPNYQIRSVTGNLRIDPAFLDVYAADVTRVYGEPNPADTLLGISGLKFGEALASVVTLNTPASLQAPVGTYPVAATSLSSNYVVRNVVTGNVTVTPRPITLIGKMSTRYFGNDNSPASISLFSGTLASFDTEAALFASVTASTIATARSSPGVYEVDVNPPAIPNYDVKLAESYFQIFPRPITLIVDNLARYYGDPNPVITATIGANGLAPFHSLGDVISLTGGLPATTADVGFYGYYPTILDAKDYAITLTGGYVTIAPRNVTLAVDSLEVKQDETVPPFTATVTTLPSGVTVASAFPSLTFATAATSASYNPAVRPATNLADYTPPARPASILLSANNVNSAGKVTLATSVTSLPIATPVVPPTVTGADFSFTFAPPLFSTSGTATSEQLITVDGFNSNPNYAVTSAYAGRVTTVVPDPAKEARDADIAAAAADAKVKLTVGTTDSDFVPVTLPAPLTSPQFAPLLTEAVKQLQASIAGGNADLIQAFVAAGLDPSFAGGIDSFLADISTNNAKQVMVVGALAQMVTTDAHLPPELQSPALAQLVSLTMQAAQQAKLAQEKQAVANYDAWVAAQVAGPGDMSSMFEGSSDVPNFVKEARTQLNGVAIASVVVGGTAGGLAVGLGLSAALPASVVTFAGTGGSILTGVTSSTAVAGSTAGAAAAPVFATGVVIAGSIARAFLIAKSEQNLADVEAARVDVNSGALPPLDIFNNKGDLQTFTSAFYGLVGSNGFGG